MLIADTTEISRSSDASCGKLGRHEGRSLIVGEPSRGAVVAQMFNAREAVTGVIHVCDPAKESEDELKQ